ncbi:hypothetical protein LI99_16365 [Mycolicibacterium smegmatis]|jgi:hypothetical protein|uniref:Uncharacterized protein n=1 Tax=Mycolicibacterium smegmatis (strain ATCC 700084 / mc(2)155) TaxID=246196 RepID=A0QXG6_MYCS2|nr:hypothetical protein MSMEG_3293 [Mycolicibacterium smegmatis MC2 155]AIU15063.1 hypothetical protein LI99_16365 [Mycolicibacterium smegmatis]AIU08438.1 hypothetical protein LJ00_16360 [Mycolicibacterium smegmatis MC2 155]AIU21686.1 hypothetical protein LI98_16370 [Mycolicibacterium smegmatis]TBH44816.1 hypothetical protein EYS45_14825 [Mycolicibacterium smegmatis MC2 155]
MENSRNTFAIDARDLCGRSRRPRDVDFRYGFFLVCAPVSPSSADTGDETSTRQAIFV